MAKRSQSAKIDLSNPYRVEFTPKDKPIWVPLDPETGRPGYWLESFARVSVFSLAYYTVYPTKRPEKKAAINEAIDTAIRYLTALKIK